MENVTQESRGKSGKSKEEILRALNRSIGDNPKNELNPELKLKMSGLNDVDCFVVDGAIIKCDQMSDRINEEHLKATDYCVLYGEYLPEEYPGQFKRDIRRLSAVQAECQTANGIRFATVKDCVCQRDVDEGKEKKASILSMGYCNLYEKSDLKILRENIDKAREHGTCYCLMNLVSEWTNSRSIEIHKGRNKAEYSPCRNTMKFYTNEGPIERLTMGATLMCTRGGRITLVTSGQNRFFVPTIILDPAMLGKGRGQDGMDKDMTLEDAREMMAQYLRGELDEDTLNGIIPWVADNCGLTVENMKKGKFGPKEGAANGAYQRSSQFDDQILAWTYYWNCKLDDAGRSYEIDPNIVKAIIAVESSFGDNYRPGRNPTRNVMQSLATGNDAVWIAAGINPYDWGMFGKGDKISYQMLDGTIKTDGDIYGGNLFEHAQTTPQQDSNEKTWLEKEREKCLYDEFDVIKDIFVIGNDGKYMVIFDNVTPNMSIATGIGVLANKIHAQDDNIAKGVMAYKTKGDTEYLNAVNGYLDDMGCKKLVP